MLQQLLHFEEMPKYLDATDGLAWLLQYVITFRKTQGKVSFPEVKAKDGKNLFQKIRIN